MKKIKITILLTFSVFTIGCNLFGPPKQKTVNLSSGRTADVFFERQLSQENQDVLVVDYKTDEKILKARTVEQDVSEIWNAVKAEAEKMEIREAVIRYRIFEGEESKEGKPVKLYTGLLFTAEKIENGDWKIDKIY